MRESCQGPMINLPPILSHLLHILCKEVIDLFVPPFTVNKEVLRRTELVIETYRHTKVQRSNLYIDET